MEIRSQKHPVFATKNRFNEQNGFLIPIFNVHDGFIAPENYPKQIYLTVCNINEVKGPHMHKKRWGFFTCLLGNVRIIVKTPEGYKYLFSGEDHNFATIEVPAGIPLAIQNIGNSQAYILNMPCPSWHIDDQDDYPIEFDEAVFSLK